MLYYKTILGKTPVGEIAIYSQDDYIISLRFGNSEEFDKKFELSKGCSTGLITAALQLDQYFHGLRKEFDLNIACEAAEFEAKVWSAICSVPYGKTMSYKELAEKCGSPKAYRAAGNAAGKNPIPIIIPCHRIIASDGSIGGFSSDLNIKRALLEIEQKYAEKK